MKFRKSQFVFYACMSFIIGVGLASFFTISWTVIYFAGLVSIIMIIFSKAKSSWQLAFLCFLFFVLGYGRYQLSIPIINENQIAFYNNQKVVFQGVIADEPDARLDQVKLTIKSWKLKAKTGWQDIQGNVLVNTNLYPQYNYNDIVEISCKLAAPEPIEDFQYDKYLAKSDIYSVCYRGQIKLIGHFQGNFVKSFILKIKNKVVWLAGQILPEPQASFLGGLLWGAKKGLPPEILNDFTAAGVTHIIAVSGYNITIIAVALTSIFVALGFGKKTVFWLIVLCIAFFVAITGFPASIIRAGIMGIIVLMSQTLGRVSNIKNTLALTALVMLLVNPKILIWDAGFQLSFLSTIGLVYLSPLMVKWLKWLPNFLGIQDSLSTTLSAIVFTTPLILWQFGRFSVVAPLANLLILPAIPLMMLLGFIAIALGLIWLPAGSVAAWPLWLGLTYILNTAHWLAALSWSNINL
ncbi:MAG: ComEC/Rec2 family competence protein [Patescibacteria group bacterium]